MIFKWELRNENATAGHSGKIESLVHTPNFLPPNLLWHNTKTRTVKLVGPKEVSWGQSLQGRAGMGIAESERNKREKW